MKHKFHIISLTAVAALMIAGCESPTNPPSNIITVAPSPTLFVVNEGFFGHNNSSLDAMLFKTDSGKTDTISDHNVLSGMGEGNDILLNGNRAIILDNGANSI